MMMMRGIVIMIVMIMIVMIRVGMRVMMMVLTKSLGTIWISFKSVKKKYKNFATFYLPKYVIV